MPSDAFHLATMKELGIKVIATDDSDFKRVEWAVLVELGVLPRKILITGGAGFVGSHVAEFYANRRIVNRY